MPDDDEQTSIGDIVIGMDAASPDGPIVVATRDPQGRISVVQAASIAVGRITPDGHVVVGEVLPPGATFRGRSASSVGSVHIGPPGSPAPVNLEDFDLGAYTDVGYTSTDGVSWTETDSVGRSWTGTTWTEAPLPPASPYATIEQILAAEEYTHHAAEARLALLARTEYEARTDTAPAPAGDVLDRIDAAVAELCACGCRKQVPPDGASAYFADADCQRRWHSAQTTDPDAVYRRPDAASVYVGADHAAVPLRHAVDSDPEPETPRSNEPLQQCPDLLGAGYRRDCRRCGSRVVPRYERDSEFDIRSFGSHVPIRHMQPEVLMVCPGCGCGLDGPLLYADVYEDEGHLVLLLTDGQSTIRRRLRLATLLANEYRAPDVERTWAVMERELLRFRRQWVGRTLAAERMAMSVMNPTSAVRITGMI